VISFVFSATLPALLPIALRVLQKGAPRTSSAWMERGFGGEVVGRGSAVCVVAPALVGERTAVLDALTGCRSIARFNNRGGGGKRPFPFLLLLISFRSLPRAGELQTSSPLLPVALPGVQTPAAFDCLSTISPHGYVAHGRPVVLQRVWRSCAPRVEDGAVAACRGRIGNEQERERFGWSASCIAVDNAAVGSDRELEHSATETQRCSAPDERQG